MDRYTTPPPPTYTKEKCKHNFSLPTLLHHSHNLVWQVPEAALSSSLSTLFPFPSRTHSLTLSLFLSLWSESLLTSPSNIYPLQYLPRLLPPLPTLFTFTFLPPHLPHQCLPQLRSSRSFSPYLSISSTVQSSESISRNDLQKVIIHCITNAFTLPLFVHCRKEYTLQ